MGVCMVSEGVWHCLDGVYVCLADECGGRCHINLEQLNKYHGIQISLFLPVASCRPNMTVPVRHCLKDV